MIHIEALDIFEYIKTTKGTIKGGSVDTYIFFGRVTNRFQKTHNMNTTASIIRNINLVDESLLDLHERNNRSDPLPNFSAIFFKLPVC